MFQPRLTLFALLVSATLTIAVPTAGEISAFQAGLQVDTLSYTELQNEVGNLKANGTSFKLAARLTGSYEGVYLC